MRTAILFSLLSAVSLRCSAAPDPNLLAFVPSNTKLVIGFDGIAVRSSEFGQFMLTQSRGQDRDMDEFIERTGIDPRRDVDYLVIAVSFARDTHIPGVFLMRGSFDPQRLAGRAKASGYTAQTYEGIEMLQGKPRQPALAFLQPGLLAAGDPAVIRDVISGRSGQGALDPKLAQTINQVSADNDVWFAGLPIAGHGLAISPDLPPQLQNGQVLQSIQQVDGGVHLGTTVKVTLLAVTRSSQDAGALSDVIRFLATTTQTQAQNSPQAAILAPAFEHMLLATSGPDVHLSLTIPEKSLEQLAQVRPKPSR
jgi:hypothetical protein